jgi:hypothetical protein
MYFPKMLRLGEINLVILSSFGERNGFQVERNELPRDPSVNLGT